ncbi:MAG: DUF1343 domain-containing protein, partial [Candidatus Glassbacteria bacterium]
MTRVICGADRLFEEKEFRGLVERKRVAAVVNHSAVLADYTFWPAVLAERTSARLVRLFSPEHGLWGEEQDQVSCGDERESPLGVPVASLYGDRPEALKPRAGLLRDLDLLLFDIQDVGSRYYTYVYTMAFVMEAAAEAGVRFVVLDRPNPLGGEIVEGPPLVPGFESFVGRFAGLPVRHGLTVGELARWFHLAHGVGNEPEVVPVSGWERPQTAFDYDAPWVLPSPNMPTPGTALVYPGMCLIEGTVLSEGRGTTRPFEIFGAPWLDPLEAAGLLNSLGLPGVRFRPHRFIPTFGKFAGIPCGGVQLHVTDRRSFRPFAAGVAALWAAHELDPGKFAWLDRPYEFVRDIPAIDLLFGSRRLREAIDGESDWETVVKLCAGDEKRWHEQA